MLRQGSSSVRSRYLSLLSTAQGVSPLSVSLQFHKDGIPVALFFLEQFPIRPVRLTASFRSRANISACHDWCSLIPVQLSALSINPYVISHCLCRLSLCWPYYPVEHPWDIQDIGTESRSNHSRRNCLSVSPDTAPCSARYPTIRKADARYWPR